MEGDISSAMGGSGSLAGDMPSLKSLLQVKWWSLYDIQCLRFLFYLFSSCNILSWRRNTMHPTLKICQMSTRGTLTRKGCIFGLRRTFGNRSSTNTLPWTPSASHARTSVTLRSWSWHSSRLLLLTRTTGSQTYSDVLSFSADSFALLPFIRPQRVFQIRQWLPFLPGKYVRSYNQLRTISTCDHWPATQPKCFRLEVSPGSYGHPLMYWPLRLAVALKSVASWSAFFSDSVLNRLLFAGGWTLPHQEWIDRRNSANSWKRAKYYLHTS